MKEREDITKYPPQKRKETYLPLVDDELEIEDGTMEEFTRDNCGGCWQGNHHLRYSSTLHS
jgi:hypothetical protein